MQQYSIHRSCRPAGGPGCCFTRELTYHPTPDTDYLVLDLRPAYQSESMAEAAPFLEAGYEVVACWEDAAAILRAPAEG